MDGEDIVIREVDEQGYFVEFPENDKEETYNKIRTIIQRYSPTEE